MKDNSGRKWNEIIRCALKDTGLELPKGFSSRSRERALSVSEAQALVRAVFRIAIIKALFEPGRVQLPGLAALRVVTHEPKRAPNGKVSPRRKRLKLRPTKEVQEAVASAIAEADQ